MTGCEGHGVVPVETEAEETRVVHHQTREDRYWEIDVPDVGYRLPEDPHCR
jgi:hypothetical protein